jgi:hypothetical protein
MGLRAGRAGRLDLVPPPQARAAARLVVGLDEAVLIPMLTDMVPELERSPENARFIFNDDTRQLDLLRSAVIGRGLDVPASLDAIQQAAGAAQHEVASSSRPRLRPSATTPRPSRSASPRMS